MLIPRVTEIPRKRHGENAEQGDRGPRQPRRAPYHRPSQRELVRQALALEGRFDDYHGDHRR